MNRIIAAVRNNEEFKLALNSSSELIFVLSSNIDEIKEQSDMCHALGKRLFIHLDFAEGIGKDEYGIRFAKQQGVDGIISTRTNLIRLAKKAHIFTVQRFFIVDSHSVETTIDAAKASDADMIEIMPGVVTKVIPRLKSELTMPIVAGGMIETKAELAEALRSGAAAVSTGKTEFWKIK